MTLSKADTKTLARLNEARAVWSDHVRGDAPEVIADRYGWPLKAAEIRKRIQAAREIVGELRHAEIDIDEVRQLEAARLDEMMASIYDTAIGKPLESYVHGLLTHDEEVDMTDPLSVSMLGIAIEKLGQQQIKAQKAVLDIMERRAKLLASDRQAPPANLVLMPTIVFTAPGPGQRDPRAHDIIVDSTPVEVN